MRKILLVAAALSWAMLAGGAARAADVPQLLPDDRVLGNADAPITIFEYFSLTCPHCATFDQVTLPQVKKDWIDTGKAKLVYRDYPLDQEAMTAAVKGRGAPFLGICVGMQLLATCGLEFGVTVSRLGTTMGTGPEVDFRRWSSARNAADASSCIWLTEVAVNW